MRKFVVLGREDVFLDSPEDWDAVLAEMATRHIAFLDVMQLDEETGEIVTSNSMLLSRG